MDNRNIIIVGGPMSGKTTKAREISAMYDQERVRWFDYLQLKGPFKWRSCNADIELVIVERFNDPKKIHDFSSFIEEGICVEKIGSDPFYINPKLILVCDPSFNMLDLPLDSKAFNRRFRVIDCGEGAIEGRFDPDGAAKFVLIRLDEFGLSRFDNEEDAINYISDQDVSAQYLLVDMKHTKYIER
jgi:hypothetical protein